MTTALTGVGVWMVSKPGSNPFNSFKSAGGQEKATADQQKSPAAAGRRQAQARPAEEEVFKLRTNGVERAYKLALDEVAVKKSNGEMHHLRLTPAATPETLATRISELKQTDPVYPVCYPEGMERNPYTRSIITPDITVQMVDGHTDLPSLPSGLQLKDRPSYAPDMAVLTATDPFAALGFVEKLKGMSTLALAEIQLAVQRQPRAVPNDTFFGTHQWNLKNNAQVGVVPGTDINVESVWGYPVPAIPADDLGFRGKGIRIAVIDDALQTNHPDLALNVDTLTDKDYLENDGDPSPKLNQNNPHGTSVAGIIAAVANNGEGISGVAPEATLVGFRLINGPTTDSQEASAMADLNSGAGLVHIKNNSWGPADYSLSGPGPLASVALRNGAAGNPAVGTTPAVPPGRDGKGTIYVFAGGNGGSTDNSNYDGWANSIYTIAVGAMNSAGKQTSTSERGANLAVCAPSNGAAGIATTDLTGNRGYNAGTDPDYTFDFGGTSAAAPAVSGVIALMLQAKPDLGWRDVKEILIRSAKKIDVDNAEWVFNQATPAISFNPKYGAGLVDAAAAVTLAKTWTNLGTQLIAERLVSPAPPLPQDIPDNNANGKSFTFDFKTPKNESGTQYNPSMRLESVTLEVQIEHSRVGDLEILLESPRGTVSRLAERHKSSFNYEQWTFSSVQFWGENSIGTWKLTIKDRVGTPVEGGPVAAGKLKFGRLKLYGASEPAKNPPPVVAITSPTDGSALSPGQPLTLTVESKDTNVAGQPGFIKKLELFDNGVFVEEKAPPPPPAPGVSVFNTSFVPFEPADGTHVYTIKATDTEDAFRISNPITVTFGNKAPVIDSAQITPAGQAFHTEAITVSSVVVTDPENDTIFPFYQWQRSTDTFTFVNVPGKNEAVLPADAANAGYVWRCVYTAKDAAENTASFITNTVNIINPPTLAVAKGAPYSYNSGLIIRSTDVPLLRQVVFNEFSQGSALSSPYSNSEWLELLTLKAGSLRSWRLTDTAGNQLAFTNNAIWDNIPAGTLIVIYNGGTPKDPLLPADDFDVSDKTLLISSTNKTYFVQGTYWPGFANGGDSVVLRNNNFEPVAQFSYGSDNTITPHFDGIDAGTAIQYNGDTDLGNENPANWKTTTSLITRNVRLPADIPFQYGGPWGAGEVPTSIIPIQMSTFSESLGGDTKPGSAMFTNQNFDGEGVRLKSSLTIQFASPANLLTYTLAGAGNGAYTTQGQFLVMAGGTVLRTITNKDYTQKDYQDVLPPNTREVTFIYNQMQQGVILLDKVGIYPTNPLFFSVSPTTFAENAGPNAAVGTVSLVEPAVAPVTITLSSSDLTTVTVPVSVTIPAGESSRTFPISAVDDQLSDGLQTADITVSSPSYTSNTVTVLVTDNEPNAEGVTPKEGNTAVNSAWVTALRNGSLIKPTPFRWGAGSARPAGLTLNETTGVISGTVTADVGVYDIVVERYNSVGDPGESVSVSFQLTVIEPGAPLPGSTPPAQDPASTLATYSTPSNGSGSGTIDTADRDGDGLGDLAEYYLGSDPNTNDASEFMPVVESNGTSVSMTYVRSNRAAEMVQGTVEWTNTLPNGTWSTVGVQEVILEQNTFWTKIRATVQKQPSESKFLRLRVEPKQL